MGGFFRNFAAFSTGRAFDEHPLWDGRSAMLAFAGGDGDDALAFRAFTATINQQGNQPAKRTQNHTQKRPASGIVPGMAQDRADQRAKHHPTADKRSIHKILAGAAMTTPTLPDFPNEKPGQNGGRAGETAAEAALCKYGRCWHGRWPPSDRRSSTRTRGSNTPARPSRPRGWPPRCG